MSGGLGGMPSRYWMTPREFMEWADIHRDNWSFAILARGGQKPVVRVPYRKEPYITVEQSNG